MSDDTHNTIKQTTEHLLSLLGFDGAVIVTERAGVGGEKTILCNISIERDAHLLIGQQGGNLRALQHLAVLAARKKDSAVTQFVVDVNAYRAEKEEYIERLAQEAAQKSIKEKKPVMLQPMGAYERRIVHVTLAEDDTVVTESIGEGDERKVIVRAASVGAA